MILLTSIAVYTLGGHPKAQKGRVVAAVLGPIATAVVLLLGVWGYYQSQDWISAPGNARSTAIPQADKPTRTLDEIFGREQSERGAPNNRPATER